MERDLTPNDPDLTVRDLAGRPVLRPRLGRDTPLVVLSNGPAPQLGENLLLGPQRVVADSLDWFVYPDVASGGFERFARVDGQAVPFVLGPGQQTGGVPWTPYLIPERDGSLRVDAEFLMPSMWDGVLAEIVHAFTAPDAMTLAVKAELSPPAGGADGVVISFRRNDRLLAATVVGGPADITLARVDLAPGDVLEIVAGPGAATRGASRGCRFTLRRAD